MHFVYCTLRPLNGGEQVNEGVSGASVKMADGPINWGIALRVYWTIVWRTLAMYVLVYAPFTLWVFATGRLDDTYYIHLHLPMAWLLLCAAGFIAVRMALRKRYRGFRFQLVREPVS